MIRRLQITLLALFVGVWAMASETSVKNADGVEIWYDFDSNTMTASVTYKGGAYYTSYDEYIGNVVVPSKVTYEGEEYSVTKIGEWAFWNCSSLTSITLPESVTSIEENAFYECSSLTSITIPKGVTEIGQSAFSGCSYLISITLPESVTSIGSYAFSGCISLTSITIPEGVTEIRYDAFGGCYKLYEVYNKSNLTITAGSFDNGYVALYAKKVYTDESGESKLHTVGDYIFYVDEDNIELLAYIGDEIAITLPSDYEGKDYIIANYAFSGCSSLTSVTLPENVTEIASGAFSGCSSLTSITLPEGVTEIGESAFEDCSSLISVTLPEGVTEIGNDAFYRCSSLTSITLPESVTSIGDYAFSKCHSLTSITIPEGVSEIGNGVFSTCISLTSITLPEGVTEIGNNAFFYCNSLTSITIPEGVTSIEYSAFQSCNSLTSITLPKSVTEIGNFAFQECSSLTSITLPEGVTEIGESAFGYCSSLTSITIPEGVTSIGDYAFYLCSSLTSIDVASDNNNYTSIDGVLFSKDKTILINYPGGKKDVTSYAIPESVTSIGSYAFSNCISLTSITIPESVTSIGGGAFSECYRLYEVYNKSNLTITAGSSDNGYVAYYAKNVYTDESGESKLHIVGDYIFYVDEDNIELLACIGDKIAVTLPSDYEGKDYIIAGSAFDGCSSLTSITIPKGVTSIGKYAFRNCSSLTSITIPESVTEIGEWAFVNCSSLTSITSKNVTPPSIVGIYPFDGVDKSIPVYVPKQSVEAYKSAEYWKDFTNIQGIDDTPISNIQISEINVRLIGNTIVVEGTDNYFVYSISGQCLGKVESLERGVYIVVADGVSKRIVVK